MRTLFFLFSVFIFTQNLFCEQGVDGCQEDNNMSIEFSGAFEFTEDQVKDYHNKPSNNAQEIRKIIESGFFGNSKEILDVGCGEGRLTALFAANLPHTSIVGCDVSKTMIEYALRHHVSSNLSFIEMNAENLDFQQKFDTVISFSCLHWVRNQKRVISQIFNVLKPGGKALLVATPASSNNDFKTVCSKVILSFRWLPYFLTFRSVHSFHTEQEYKKLLMDTGFLIDKIQINPTKLTFKNRDELEPFLKAVLTPLQHLHPSNQPAFLEDFFQELIKQGKVDADGSIHIFFDQIELLVSKNI